MKNYNIQKAIVYDGDVAMENIRNRQIREIVSPNFSAKHTGEEVFICDRDKVYGIIILNTPTTLDHDQFKNHHFRHLISNELKDSIWKGANKFQAYTFRTKKIFKEPIEYIYDGQYKLAMGDFIEDLKFIDKEKEEFDAKINKYRNELETFRNLECTGEEAKLKVLFEDLYELTIDKMISRKETVNA